MKLLFKKLSSLIPTPLPRGRTAFTEWVASIQELAGPDVKDVPEADMLFILSSMVIHLGPQRSRIPKNYFVRSLHKAAANQVASQIFQEIKQQQAEQQQAKAANETKAETAKTTEPGTI